MDWTTTIVTFAVPLVVLESDIGHRKVTAFRTFRPLVLAVILVPFFISGLQLSGAGLVLEIVAVLAGGLVGIGLSAIMTFDDDTGVVRTRAGWIYVFAWLLVTAVKILFQYGAVHWFGPQLFHWLTEWQISTTAFADSILFFTLCIALGRVGVLYFGARGVRRNQSATAPCR